MRTPQLKTHRNEIICCTMTGLSRDKRRAVPRKMCKLLAAYRMSCCWKQGLEKTLETFKGYAAMNPSEKKHIHTWLDRSKESGESVLDTWLSISAFDLPTDPARSSAVRGPPRHRSLLLQRLQGFRGPHSRARQL